MISEVGATDELSLRVSVATLVRVLFKQPSDGNVMLALERRAIPHPGHNGQAGKLKSQPFGGAIRILDPMKLRHSIGDFHFDSEHSRSEQDFRIFIRPSTWETVRRFCIQQFSRPGDFVLETDPVRELTEEFSDALNVSLEPGQYFYNPVTTLLENDPSPTENINARGIPTVRIYRVFEAMIADGHLIDAMINSSHRYSNESPGTVTLETHNGGYGGACAVLVLPLKPLMDFYRTLSPPRRNVPMLYEDHCLDETVTAALDEIAAPKYQRV